MADLPQTVEQQLYARFIAGLPARGQSIDAAWRDYVQDPERGRFAVLCALLHALAGAAAMFGEHTLSNHALRVSELLLCDARSPEPLGSEILALLARCDAAVATR